MAQPRESGCAGEMEMCVKLESVCDDRLPERNYLIDTARSAE